MSYGSSPYGSTALGSASGATGQVFFPFGPYPTGQYEAQAENLSTASFYELRFQQNSGGSEIAEEELVEYKVYSHNDPHETPQLQVTMGSALSSQTIIGAARFITVRMNVVLNDLGISVFGRPYNQ
jgi:hypothetical protein